MSFSEQNKIETRLPDHPFKDVYELDNFIQANYNVIDNYLASDLFQLPLEKCANSISLKELNFINNKETICLLFPNYGVRIACTRNFVNKIPFVKSLIDKRDKNIDNFKVLQYYNDYLRSIEMGSCLIILKSTEMESLLMESSISIQIKNWKNKNYYTLENKICQNLYDVVFLTNQISDDAHYFDGYSN